MPPNMPPKEIRYEVEILSLFKEWWRYNLYLMVVCYDEEGNRGEFNNVIDRVYEIDSGGAMRDIPDGYDPARVVKVVSEPCAYVEVYAYVVTNTFPRSIDVKDSPPFMATIKVSAEGRVLYEKEHAVNQWGGVTVVGEKVSVDG